MSANANLLIRLFRIDTPLPPSAGYDQAINMIWQGCWREVWRCAGIRRHQPSARCDDALAWSVGAGVAGQPCSLKSLLVFSWLTSLSLAVGIVGGQAISLSSLLVVNYIADGHGLL